MTIMAPQYQHVGEKIRALRMGRQLTQTALAATSGVNIATICLIEKGKRPGTVEVHGKLARALGLTLSELYAGMDEERRESTAFQPAPPKTETYAHPGLGFSIQPLTMNVLEKRMLPLLLQLEPGGATVQEQARAGSHTEKFLYVQQGAVEVRVGEERFTVRRQQTLYFDATLTHQIRNPGRQRATVFVVVSPPTL